MCQLHCRFLPLWSPYSAWLILAVLIVASAPAADGQCNNCKTCSNCNNCGDVQYYNIKAEPFPLFLITGTSASPLFGVLETNISCYRGLDNVCTTFFPITNNEFMFVRSYVFKDASYRVELYTARDLPGSIGEFRIEGFDFCGTSSIVYGETLLGLGCPVSFALTKNYYYSNCGKIVQQEGKQLRYALTAQKFVPDACVELLKEICNSQPQLGKLEDDEFIELPNNLPMRCVTKYKNASCINADKVSEENSICLPYHDCFC